MRLWMVLVGIDGAIAVAMGAYGAHALADAGAYPASLWDKATRYQMYHTLALGLAALWAERRGGVLLQAACALFVAGTLLFCGSLYTIALTGLDLARVTPFGGLAFLAGWACMAGAGLRQGAGESVGRESKPRRG